MAVHLDDYWDGGRPATLGLERRRIDKLRWVVTIPAHRAYGTVDHYYLLVDATFYDLHPPVLRLVMPPDNESPDGAWPEARPGTGYWPTFSKHHRPPWFQLHEHYKFTDNTEGHLLCFSHSADYYRSGHNPSPTQVWRQGRHTVAASISRVAQVLEPPYYIAPSGPPQMIVVPKHLWRQLLDAFEEEPTGHERIGYLDGVRVDGGGVVTTVTLPNAHTARGYYTVPAAAMSEAGAHFRRHGLVRLVQVHTHGNGWVNHSPRDDRLAYSQRVGAVSLVLPHHACHRHAPTDSSVGVHVRRADGWQRLGATEADDLITVVPSLLDHRRQPCRTTAPRTGTVATLRGWYRWIQTRRSRSDSS